MKIAMIGHKDFPSRSGGVEVVVYELSTRLAARGHEVTVYNRGRQKGHNVYQERNVRVKRIFTFKKQILNAMVYSFLATFDTIFHDFDVIHSCDRSLRSIVSCKAVWQAYGMHGAWPELEK